MLGDREHLTQFKQDLMDASKIEKSSLDVNKLKRWIFSFLRHMNLIKNCNSSFLTMDSLKMLPAEYITLILNNKNFTLKINITTQYIST